MNSSSPTKGQRKRVASDIVLLLLSSSRAQTTAQVWTQIKNGPPLSPDIQTRFDISRSTTGIGTALQIVLNGSCLVLYTDRERPWGTQRFGTPYFPCAAGILDPHIAYYESGSFGNPRWFLSGYYEPNGTNPALDAKCVNATLQSYEIDGSTCGSGSWLQHSFNPPFALHDFANRRVGYYSRFATATGPVILGGRNASTGVALTDVWANCRSYFDCPNLGWRRGDDVPEGCASAEHALVAFSVDDVVYILCGGNGQQPGAVQIYYLRHPGLHWVWWGEAPAGSLPLPLALTQIEQLNGPDDVPPVRRVPVPSDRIGSDDEMDAAAGDRTSLLGLTGSAAGSASAARRARRGNHWRGTDGAADSGLARKLNALVTSRPVVEALLSPPKGSPVDAPFHPSIATPRPADALLLTSLATPRAPLRTSIATPRPGGRLRQGSIATKGGCVVAISGGGGNTQGYVSTSYDGIQWMTHPAPYGSRSRPGFTYWRPNRMAVLGGLDTDGVTYYSDGWGADVTLCCATTCDSRGNCTLCSGRGYCAVDAHYLCYCDAGYSGYYCEVDASTLSPTRTPSQSPSFAGGGSPGSPAGVGAGALTGVALASAAAGSVLTFASMIMLSRGRGFGWQRLFDRSGGGSGEMGFTTSASVGLTAEGETDATF